MNDQPSLWMDAMDAIGCDGIERCDAMGWDRAMGSSDGRHLWQLRAFCIKTDPIQKRLRRRKRVHNLQYPRDNDDGGGDGDDGDDDHDHDGDDGGDDHDDGGGDGDQLWVLSQSVALAWMDRWMDGWMDGCME
jgi:hypothetical protein